MRFSKTLLSGLVIAGLVAAPLSSASAGWRHRGHVGLVGGIFGLATGVVVGAAAIATAPIAIVAGAGQRSYDAPPPTQYGPPSSYAPQGAYYGPPRGYYGPAPYGPPPQYNAPPNGYYGPPPGY
jgi:hypothetical protein